MRRLVDWVQAAALAAGAPGLFVIAFLDSSFLSLPEINDLLLIWMVTQHNSRMLLYAASATLGSIAGCLVLYYIGRKGGDALVRRRFSSDRAERALNAIQRYGVMSVLIPSLLPPPAPFKIFVLLAGVAEVPVWRFVAAIGIGRGLRYFIEGILAIRYGDAAIAFIGENGKAVAYALVVILAVGLAAYVLVRKARARAVR